MMSTLSLVALGGAFGAVLRYLSGVALLKLAGPTEFPFTIILVNVLGSFLMGLAAVAVAQREMPFLHPLLMTGVLGGFTTFSAFSLEAVTLFERGEITAALLYVAISVIGAIAALGFGLWCARAMFL
ncbi:MAG: fluoride efflux transporter CrcB [Pseudomonadota bacterium]